MKTKIVIVVLAVVCLGLGIALFIIKSQTDDQHTKDISSIVDISNQLVSASQQVNSLDQVNLGLTNDLALSRQQSVDLSNSLAGATAALADTKSDLAGAKDQMAQLTNQVSSLNTQIASLETQNQALDQRAGELTNTIAQLSAKIEATENQLAVSETNRAFIQAELQKQMAEKAELERKFNDLNTVRAQVKKLKDELFVQRRIQLDKNTNVNKKGGQILMERTPSVVPPKPVSGYDLNVEVGSDGSVKVIPPLGATNSVTH